MEGYSTYRALRKLSVFHLHWLMSTAPEHIKVSTILNEKYKDKIVYMQNYWRPGRTGLHYDIILLYYKVGHKALS